MVRSEVEWITTNPLSTPASSLAARGAGGARSMVTVSLRRSLRDVLDALLTWQERARERRQLLSLDDHVLRDIGVTRAEAEREWRKPFWRV